jgi:hypothetical protein
MEGSMAEDLDLKALERKAFRSTFQDGIWDLYIAGMMLNVALFYLFWRGLDETGWPGFVLELVGFGVVGALFWAGKMYITTPRMGQVKFGPARRRRKAILAAILGVFVLLHALLVVFQFFVLRDPGASDGINAWLTAHGAMDLALGLLVGGWLGMVMGVIAYFSDFPRGYYIAILIGLGFFLTFWLDQPLILGLLAACIAVPGAILLRRFLHDHPLPQVNER